MNLLFTYNQGFLRNRFCSCKTSSEAWQSLSAQLLVMCSGNRNDFYSTARLNESLGYLLDNKCYDSLADLLTQIQ